MAICEQCGKEFEAKRDTARYCSGRCRKAANRIKRDKPVTDNVTDNPSVTISNNPADLIAEARGRAGHRLMPEDVKDIPVGQFWRYTRHLSPEEAIRWMRVHRPQWCSTVKPGDPDYPQECIGGVCQTCGADTELKSITTCHACVAAKYKEAS